MQKRILSLLLSPPKLPALHDLPVHVEDVDSECEGLWLGAQHRDGPLGGRHAEGRGLEGPRPRPQLDTNGFCVLTEGNRHVNLAYKLIKLIKENILV